MGYPFLCPPAEDFYSRVRLHEGRLSLKMLSALLSCLIPLATGSSSYSGFFFFFLWASSLSENYASAGWMGGRERKPRGPGPHCPLSLKTPWPSLFHPSESFQTGWSYAKVFLFACSCFPHCKGNKEEGGLYLARTGNFYFDIFLNILVGNRSSKFPK